MTTTMLDLKAMTDREVTRELARIHENLLSRLNAYWYIGTGDDSEAEPQPDQLDAGLALGQRLQLLEKAFKEGGDDSAKITRWNVGVDYLMSELSEASLLLALEGMPDPDLVDA